MIPTSIDGTDIAGATIDGTDVTEITVDGDTVFTAEPPLPGIAVNQYDATTLSTGIITQWDDSLGSLDLTGGSPEVVSNGINGNTSVRFDGTDELSSSSRASNISQPFTVGVVLETDTNLKHHVFDGINQFTLLRDQVTLDRFNIYAGDGLFNTGNDALNNPSVVFCVFNGSNSKIRFNGSETTGSAGSNANDGVRLGKRQDGADSSNYLDGDLGEVIVYNDELAGSDLTDEENRLKDKFGITF